jgi:voltage-gated potassium channel
MKFLVGTYMSFLLKDKQAQRNIRALLKYLLFVVIVVSLYTTIFHYIKLWVEGEYYTWITGI